MKLIAVFFLTFVTSLAQANFSLRLNTGVMEFEPSAEQKKYAELELGYDYALSEALSLRASAFGRSADEETFWGFQVATPLSLIVPGGFIGSYLAPGYRYMNDDYSAPLIEGGINLYFLGNFGLGYRAILNEWVKNGLRNESQFFVSVEF